MKRYLLASAAIFGCVIGFASFVKAQGNRAWIGKFEHHDGYQEEETLVVKEQNAKTTAIFRELNTDQLWTYFSLTVEINGDTASFFYDKCLPKKGDPKYEEGVEGSYPCSEDPYKTGDLMFRLVKSVGKNGRVKILTYAEKFESIDRADHIFLYASK